MLARRWPQLRTRWVQGGVLVGLLTGLFASPVGLEAAVTMATPATVAAQISNAVDELPNVGRRTVELGSPDDALAPIATAPAHPPGRGPAPPKPSGAFGAARPDRPEATTSTSAAEAARSGGDGAGGSRATAGAGGSGGGTTGGPGTTVHGGDLAGSGPGTSGSTATDPSAPPVASTVAPGPTGPPGSGGTGPGPGGPGSGGPPTTVPSGPPATVVPPPVSITIPDDLGPVDLPPFCREPAAERKVVGYDLPGAIASPTTLRPVVVRVRAEDLAALGADPAALAALAALQAEMRAAGQLDGELKLVGDGRIGVRLTLDGACRLAALPIVGEILFVRSS